MGGGRGGVAPVVRLRASPLRASAATGQMPAHSPDRPDRRRRAGQAAGTGRGPRRARPRSLATQPVVTCGISSSRPSRRGSSSFWSSGWTSGRTRSRCGSGPRTREPSGRAAAAGREDGGMIERAETRLDGTTFVVRIPMRFQRRGGRKRIVAPDGSQIVPTSQPDGTLVKALARAWRWQRMLDEGVFTTVRKSARRRGSTRATSVRSCGSRSWLPTSSRESWRGRPIRRWCWRGWSGRCRWIGVSRAHFFRDESVVGGFFRLISLNPTFAWRGSRR
jgi:hypothetical protein